MTYAQKDKSVDSGAPIEAYEFEGEFGVLRYTSSNKEETIAGEVFTPLNISRTSIETGAVTDTVMTMDFKVPSNSELALKLCYKLSPPGLIVTVYRVHRGDNFETDYRVEWIGEGLDTEVRGEWATIKTGSILQSRMAGNVANIYYQRMCNHILGDARCKVDLDLFTFTTTITKIQAQLITVASDSTLDGELKAGVIINTRTGERRGIFNNIDNAVSISYPFTDAVVGDEVKLQLGCDHARLGHCKQRFNNVVNYGGHDFIPTVNPFTDLRPDKIVITTIKKSTRPPDPNDRGTA